jgi:GT2 family glycosyltransferase
VTPRATVAMVVHGGLAVTRACLDSLAATTEPFVLAIVDNGSPDDTPAFFRDFPYPFPLRYTRNEGNGSVLAAYNQAWRLAETEFVCLLHNDTEMLEPAWLSCLLAPHELPATGLTGLYGIRRVRRDGRYAGRTIVHSLADGPTVRPPYEEVAVVDGVCLCLRRSLLEQVGGIDEGYGFFHGYDRDLSFAVRETGRRCLVVNALFRHRGGATRTRDFTVRHDAERRDLDLRRAATERFARKFSHRLPCDVRPLRARMADWLVRRSRGLGLVSGLTRVASKH